VFKLNYGSKQSPKITKIASSNQSINYHNVLITDHKPLVSIFKNKEPTTKRHIRWITEFSAFKVTVVFEEGKKNVIADALSRLQCENKNKDKTESKRVENNIVNKNVIMAINNETPTVRAEEEHLLNNFINEFIKK